MVNVNRKGASMNDRPFVVHSHDVRKDAAYREWLLEIKNRYKSAQIKAAVKVNSEQLLFNWQLGRDLVLRRAEEKWGKGVVEQLSLDLQDIFPDIKGFSARNLWFMKQWYSFYSSKPETAEMLQTLNETIHISDQKLNQAESEYKDQKLNQVDSELLFPPTFGYVPWRHHVLIVQKCKTVKEAIFYIQRTIENNWSRRALDDNIRSNLYHAVGAAITNYTDRLPLPQGKLAQELTKSNYDLGFLTLPEGYDEKELETALEHHMTRFLLELGKGWAFVGRQKEIIVSGKTRKIDLLFYHIHLRFYMVVELKVKSFEPEFAGKLNFYVNAVNELIRTANDNPTIGLLICRDMERTEVQWALQGITTPIGVATYSNVKIEEVQAQLPTTEQIKACIEQAEEEYLQRKKESESTE